MRCGAAVSVLHLEICPGLHQRSDNRERKRETERQRQRQRDRETERQRGREAERQRETCTSAAITAAWLLADATWSARIPSWSYLRRYDSSDSHWF